jgi:hypothetical protein
MQIDDVMRVILQVQSICGQFVFQMFLKKIKCAPFLFKIGEDIINDYQKRKKTLEINEFCFTTHTNTFSSNVILAPKFMKFEDMSLTNVSLL